VAESEETLRKTHSRYFDNMTEMLDKRLAHRTLPSAPSRPRSRLAFFRSRTA
jgi:hypothetical protein